MDAARRLVEHLSSAIDGFCLSSQLKLDVTFENVSEDESRMPMWFRGSAALISHLDGRNAPAIQRYVRQILLEQLPGSGGLLCGPGLETQKHGKSCLKHLSTVHVHGFKPIRRYLTRRALTRRDVPRRDVPSGRTRALFQNHFRDVAVRPGGQYDRRRNQDGSAEPGPCSKAIAQKLDPEHRSQHRFDIQEDSGA